MPCGRRANLAAAAGERDEAREGLSRVEVVKAGLLEERVRLLARSEALEARSAELEGQDARLLRVLFGLAGRALPLAAARELARETMRALDADGDGTLSADE